MSLPLNKIIQGDALQTLQQFPDECIDIIITSPPYWALRDYKIEGIIWDEKTPCEHDFHIQSKEINLVTGSNSVSKRPWREKASGTVKTGFCKKCNAWKGQLGQEPTVDLYINHLVQIFDQCKRILKKNGSCWVVLGDTYAGTGHKKHHKDPKYINGRNGQEIAFNTKVEKVPNKSLCLIPERFAFKMIENNWLLRNKIIWSKPNAMPSPAKDRFTVDYEYVYFFTKSQKYYFKTQYEHPKGRIKRCVWSINTQPFPEAHFATFPPKLVQQCLNAGCTENGVILDPFMGSGTTALVALKNNRRFVGIELNQDYIKMANKRLEPYLLQTKLIT